MLELPQQAVSLFSVLKPQVSRLTQTPQETYFKTTIKIGSLSSALQFYITVTLGIVIYCHIILQHNFFIRDALPIDTLLLVHFISDLLTMKQYSEKTSGQVQHFVFHMLKD